MRVLPVLLLASTLLLPAASADDTRTCVVAACVQAWMDMGAGACATAGAGVVAGAGAFACSSADPARPGVVHYQGGAAAYVLFLPGAHFNENGDPCVPYYVAAGGAEGRDGVPTGHAGAYTSSICVDLRTFEIYDGGSRTIVEQGICDKNGDGHGDTPCGTLT